MSQEQETNKALTPLVPHILGPQTLGNRGTVSLFNKLRIKVKTFIFAHGYFPPEVWNRCIQYIGSAL